LVSLVDTHCHLDFNIFDSDRQEVIARAREVEVNWVLNPGIDLATSQAAIQLAKTYPEMVRAAAGIHPNEGGTWNMGILAELHELAAQPEVLAIGEIGLDFYRDRVPEGKQIEILEAQLELAAELGLPVIIHSRKAIQALLPILANWQAKLSSNGLPLAHHPGVLHSFEGTLEEAQHAISLNFFIGVSGPITFTNARERKSVIGLLPLSHLVLETDAPFLTPHPHRGQRNEPGFVRLIAMKIAELLNQPLADIIETTSNNATQLFAWGV
jgi:TatD DNase family protein